MLTKFPPTKNVININLLNITSRELGTSLIVTVCLQLVRNSLYSFCVPYICCRKECFCGDTIPSSDDALSESECDSRCAGDSNEICGGGWRLSLYATGLTGMLHTSLPVS